MDWIKTLLSALDEYPGWVRWATVAWVLGSAGIVVIFVLAPRATATRGGDSLPREELARRSSTSPGSHFEAAAADELKLDCSRHRMEAEPGLYTTARVICETLSELRQNLSILHAFRAALLGRGPSLPTTVPRYAQIKRFLQNHFSPPPSGPAAETLLSLVDTLSEASAELERVGDLERLRSWNAAAPQTLDDLIVGSGFLEWLVAYEAKDKLSPAELYRMGPFYERAFPKNEPVSGRQFLVNGKPQVEYADVLGLLD